MEETTLCYATPNVPVKLKPEFRCISWVTVSDKNGNRRPQMRWRAV